MVNELDVENPDKAELKRMYNDRKRFSRTFESLDAYVAFEDRYRMHAVLKAVKRKGPLRILDNGCGSALMARQLANMGYRVTGSDISEELLRLVPKTDNLELVACDSGSLPFKSSEFDYVICSEVLEHLKETAPAIREIRRVLKDDGLAIISVPNLFCYDSLEGNYGLVSKPIGVANLILRRIGKAPIYPYGHNTHLHKMFPWQWKRLLESCGLEVVEDRAVCISPYLPDKMRFIERALYHVPGLFTFKKWTDDILSTVWPFRYLGITHLFVCKKKAP